MKQAVFAIEKGRPFMLNTSRKNKLMKKVFLFALTLLTASAVLLAQPKPQALKKTMELKMARTTDDDMPGTRGAGVVWHPLQKKYYAAFAGNIGYPLCVFDIKGKRLSDDALNTDVDTRGIWYNYVTKKIQVNAYGDNGWAEYTLDAKGIPTGVDVLFEGQNQPSDQSVGAFDGKAKSVYFLNSDGNIEKYSTATAEPTGTITLHLGKRKESDEDVVDEDEPLADYNYTTVVFTGLPGSEIALLNLTNRHIELYNIKTGYKTKELSVPEDVPMEASFNFAYANGIYWLFDMEARTWIGLK